ncbi:MAG: cation:proton antiporter [Planctomycetes bacterium]|nr:cation:proton antiporter [Planctomycetota bacterium]
MPTETPFLPDADPLFTLAIVIAAGVASSWVAKRLHLPGITGQILIGVLIGPGLRIFDPAAVHGLQPLTHFALSLIAVTVGAHLNVKRLRNAGKRLAFLFLLEGTITPLLVFGALWMVPGMQWEPAALLAAMAVSTAPATIVALVKETRSRGVFVKTLVAAVALNNVACILLFELARSLGQLAHATPGGITLAEALLAPAQQIALASLIGGAAAVTMHLLQRFVVRPETISTAGVLVILLTAGLSRHFHISPLLSCLFLGMVQTNLTPEREKLVDALFANFEPAILAIFFTLAGMELDLGLAQSAGIAGLVFFFARAAGKLGSVRLAMTLARATQKVRTYLGMALLPQAGLAIGLVLIAQDDPNLQDRPQMLHLLLAVVLTVVTLNEIVGPIFTKLALVRSGEAGRDRRRLLDFLQEQNILTGFEADSMQQAIEKLVDHMARSQSLGVERKELLASVLEREAQASTCLGGGLAVPHAILPKGHQAVGVMALSRHGLGFPTPDDKPLHCIVLLGTPRGESTLHLQILATLARTIGTDPSMQDRLFGVSSPAHASEILHGEESDDFNVFLE